MRAGNRELKEKYFQEHKDAGYEVIDHDELWSPLPGWSGIYERSTWANLRNEFKHVMTPDHVQSTSARYRLRDGTTVRLWDYRMGMKVIPKPRERWIDIPDMGRNYRLSDYGRVYSIRRGKLIAPICQYEGDRLISMNQVSLWYGGKNKAIRVHREVLRYFVAPPPDERSFVWFKDGDITNCHYLNLEWVRQEDHPNYNGFYNSLLKGKESGARQEK